MNYCICNECGIVKTQFMKMQTGRGVSKSDFSCGINLRGKRAGTVEECFKRGQIRNWGLNEVDKGLLDNYKADRTNERKLKRAMKKQPSNKKKETARIQPRSYQIMVRTIKTEKPIEEPPLTKKEEKIKNRKRRAILYRVISEAARDAISDMLKNFKTNDKRTIIIFPVEKLGKSKYRLTKQNKTKSSLSKEKLIEYIIKNTEEDILEAISQDHIEKNREKYNEILIEELKEGLRYETKDDFDRGVRSKRVIVEEP